MARAPNAAVLGLFFVALHTGVAFQPPPAAARQERRLVRRPPPFSLLSEAPAPGAWRARPSTDGVVLHARWPFGRWRRGSDKEEGNAKDSAQPTPEQATSAVVPPVNAGGGAQGDGEITVAAAAAAVDSSSSKVPSQDFVEAAVTSPDNSSGSPSTQTQELETGGAAAAATASTSEAVQIQDLETVTAVAAVAASRSGSETTTTQEVQTSASITVAGAQGEEAGTAVGGAGTGTGGTQMVAGRGGRKVAARAAVAVMERIQDEASSKREDAGRDGFAWRKARTTRDAMFNICVKEANMTEIEATRSVQSFVYALGSAPLISEAERVELIERVEEKALSVEPAVPPTTYVSKWDEEFPSIYNDELLRDIGSRAPLVAREIDEVLLSKPGSTEFSRELLSGFRTWATFEPPNVGPIKKFITNKRSFEVKTAYDEVLAILARASFAGLGEAENVGKQLEANELGNSAFRALGNPQGDLTVGKDDLVRFIQEVLPSVATMSEENPVMSSACGVTILRCRLRDSVPTRSYAATATKAALRRTALDKKLRAFLTLDKGVLGMIQEGIKEVAQASSIYESKRTGDDDLDEAALDSFDQATEDVATGFASGLMAYKESRNFLVLLVPAETKPSEDTLLGEQGKMALQFGAPITLFAFLGDAFNGTPVELASNAVDGDLHLFTQVGILGATMVGLLLARDSARFFAALKAGVELAPPLALPSFDTGLLARRCSLASYPSNADDLFDIVLAGPLVGLATSAVALYVGLQMTAGAGPEALAGFPSLPSSLLQGSSFVGSLVDAFLHTNLGAQDLAAERIAMHPLAVGGAAAMLWNAATVLPLPGSDGKTAIDTLNNDYPVAAVANFFAVAFVAVQVLGGGGDFLLSVLAISLVAYPDDAPLIREDNLTNVQSPVRLVLAFVVAALAVLVLTPMTVSPFLTGGGLSVDPGAGAESVAAGLGVGGIGFGGFL